MNTDITRNWEQTCLNRLFPCAVKVYTPEDISTRLDSIETILRVVLDRLSEVDGKRLRDEVAPFGYRVDVVNKEY